MKELTQFIGPSLIQYNNNRRAVIGFKDQGFNAQTATLGLTTLLAGHVANALIFDLLRGKQPDDLDKLPAWIMARLTLGLFDGIPVMRDIAEYAESRITGEKGKAGSRLSCNGARMPWTASPKRLMRRQGCGLEQGDHPGCQGGGRSDRVTHD